MNKTKILLLLILTFSIFFIFSFIPQPVQNLKLAYCTPSKNYLLGCSPLGENIVYLIIWGAFKTFSIALLGRLLSLTFAAFGFTFSFLLYPWGFHFFSRLSEALMTIPSLLLALVFGFILGAGSLTTILAVGISEWAYNQKWLLARQQELSRLPFIEVSKNLGANKFHQLVYHLKSFLLHDLQNLFFIYFPTSILTVASLEFLGLSSPGTTPGLGYQIAAYKDYIFLYPYMSISPIISILVLVFIATILKNILRNFKNN